MECVARRTWALVANFARKPAIARTAASGVPARRTTGQSEAFRLRSFASAPPEAFTKSAPEEALKCVLGADSTSASTTTA